ncbi:MAG: thioredoxin family protein [Flavobacteriaceae bacterium]|nr:thioredoxin family protein [Flavobacteriaceae bacterium]
MLKKIFAILSLFFVPNLISQEINWISMDKALELQKKVPKNIIMDVYTEWCGPCKIMDKNTFQNPDVVKFINNNFYAIKFNAEGNEIVNYKDRKFDNPGYVKKDYGRNSSHNFTRYLGVNAYPTIVFFDKQANPIAPIRGYLGPNQIEIYLKLFKGDDYKNIKSQDDFRIFMDSFESEFRL